MINKYLKNGFIVVLCIVLLIGFNPSYTSLNIDNLAYVIAIGVDISSNNNYTFSFQFTPRDSSSKTDSGSSSKKSSIVNTIEAPSLYSAINLLNSYLAREVNLSHCKIIVISEEIALNGVSEQIYTLMNDPQVRPSTNIIICKNKAQNYIENSVPVLENLITKYYEIFPSSNKYSGYIYNANLGDFFNQLVSNTGEPFAILGGVNNSESNDIFDENADEIGNIKSTQTTFTGLRTSENIGIAVFKGDKIVGELSAIETLCLSIIKETVQYFLLHVPDPQNYEEQIDIIVYPLNKKRITVDIVNGSPYINIDMEFIGKIYSITKGDKYLDSNSITYLSSSVSKYLEYYMKNYLYKTSIEFNSDINEFGKYALSNFITNSDFEKFDWKNNYQNSVFNVSMNIQVESGYLVTGS